MATTPLYTLSTKTGDQNKHEAGEGDRQDFRKRRRARTNKESVSFPSLLEVVKKDKEYMK